MFTKILNKQICGVLSSTNARIKLNLQMHGLTLLGSELNDQRFPFLISKIWQLYYPGYFFKSLQSVGRWSLWCWISLSSLSRFSAVQYNAHVFSLMLSCRCDREGVFPCKSMPQLQEVENALDASLPAFCCPCHKAVYSMPEPE